MTETAQMSMPVAPPPRNTFAALFLAVATIAITLGGLGIIFTSVLSLVGPSPPGFTAPAHDAIIVAGMMVMFGTLTIGLVIFLLVKLFTRVMGLAPVNNSSAQDKKHVVNNYQPAQLTTPPAVVSSVTEHTTRTFRPPVYEEANTRE
ncbi:MAG TPA: hypothetical protein VLR90_10975 [Blastocatellia bacterium]|nr:hypothetical protein [Blastocatellia bacterium]